MKKYEIIHIKLYECVHVLQRLWNGWINFTQSWYSHNITLKNCKLLCITYVHFFNSEFPYFNTYLMDFFLNKNIHSIYTVAKIVKFRILILPLNKELIFANFIFETKNRFSKYFGKYMWFEYYKCY